MLLSKRKKRKRKGPGWDGYHPAQHSGNHIWQQPRGHINHLTIASEPDAGPKKYLLTLFTYIIYYTLLCIYSYQKFGYTLLQAHTL